MPSIEPKSKGLPNGCLMLFALPFAAVGVGALVWSGWTLLDWRDAASWVPVSAEIVTVELEEHADDEGGSTYETTATYRYDYGGTSYTGTRVAIDTGADNIGGFQNRLYYGLRAALDSRTTVTAYVDPDDPNRAVLNRQLRPGLFALKGLFAVAFGGVGFGLLFGARHSGKRWRPKQRSAGGSPTSRGAGEPSGRTAA